MAHYRYSAVDQEGRSLSGRLEAASDQTALNQLREQGLIPLTVESLAAQAEGVGGKAAPRHLSTPQLVDFTRQLASLVAAGIPLERALANQSAEEESVKQKRLLDALRTEVAGGTSFATALSLFPRDFGEIYRAMVAVGEETGSMAPVLQRLADWLEARQALSARITQACLYPAIVVVVAILVVGALLTFVVPQVVGVFASARQKLPPLTAATLALSGFLRAWWMYLAAGGAAAIWLVAMSLRQPAVRQRFDQALLGLPIVGRLARDINAARFGATLGALAATGVPILRALQAAAKTLSNTAMRAAAEAAQTQVREGRGVGVALGETKLFPPSLVTFIGLGEQTGQLADMASRASARLSASVERRVVWLAGLLEPALILAMGGAVLLIVLAVLLPIIQLNTLVR